MHRIGRGFFFPLSSSGITEEVAALVCWLYYGTVLCFVVVFFSSGVENCCPRIASWVIQWTILLESVLLNFSFYKIPVDLFKISQTSAIFGGDFATTAYI